MYSLKKKRKNTHNLNSRSNVSLYATKLNITPKANNRFEREKTKKKLKMVSEGVSKRQLKTGIRNRSVEYSK